MKQMLLSGLIAILCLCTANVVRADNGVWSGSAGGYWADASNWQSGIVPGSTNLADFTALDNGESVVITNDTPIGALLFDGAADAKWFLAAESGAGMIFNNTSAAPAFSSGEICVSNGLLKISAPVTQADNGLLKSGDGAFMIFGTNDYTGSTVLNEGTMILTNGTVLRRSMVVIGSESAELSLQGDALIGGLTATDGIETDIDMNGHELLIGGSREGVDWTGTLNGTGVLSMVRGETLTLMNPQECDMQARLENGVLEMGRHQGRIVAWWRFEDAQKIGEDSGPLSNDLVPEGTPSQWQVQDAERGAVLALDNGAYLRGVGAEKKIEGIPTNNMPFTIAFWFKPAADIPLNAVLFGWGQYYGRYACNGMRFDDPSSAAPFLYTNWKNNRYVPFAGNLMDGGWHHFAVIYTGGRYMFYIDGVLSWESFVGGIINVEPDNFTLGKGWSDDLYKGLIDDFVIADYAMSASQLAAVRVDSQTPDLLGFNNMLPEDTMVEVGFNGRLRLFGEQSVATLAGAGAAGAIELDDDAVFAVQGTGFPTSTVFYSSICGNGRFEKRGADYDLTLAGGSSYTGSTEVIEGTISLNDADYPAPVAWYRFDDPNNLGRDSSGNGYDLDAVNSPAYSATGLLGGAAKFESVDQDRLRYPTGVPATMPVGNSSYTFAAWCNPDIGNYQGAVLHWGNPTTKSGESCICRFNTTTNILVSNIGNNLIVDAGVDLFDDAVSSGWHLIVSTYDGLTRTRKVYIDGVLKAMDTRSTDLNIASLLFQLGGTGYSTANYYDGLMDEVAIFDCVLSASQVQSLQSVLGIPAPIARYSFDNASQPGQDSSGNGYDLTAFENASVSPDARQGSALASGYLAWTNSVFPALMPMNNSAATFSMWLKPTWGADPQSAALFLGKTEHSACHVIRLTRTSDGRLGVRYTNAGVALESYDVDGFNFGTGVAGWHHVAAVYDPATSMRTLYIDGVAVNQDIYSRTLIVTQDYFYIGRMEQPADKRFGGNIDEVEIFDAPLTHRQVLAVMRFGADKLPVTTVLNVNSGASVNLNGESQSVAALSGGGGVDLGEGLFPGSLTVDGTGGLFSGSVTGEGGGFAAGAGSGGLTVTGDVILPTAGVVVVPDGFVSGHLTLLSADSILAPSGFDGWSVQGADESFEKKFIVDGGTLSLSVFPSGTVFIIQ